MAYELGKTIEQLPPFEEPVFVISVEINRSGSIEVRLKDAHMQLLDLFFSNSFGRMRRFYLQVSATNCIHPVAQNSQAERDIVRFLRQHVTQIYSIEDQLMLKVLDGRGGFRNISKRDHEGFLLLQCLKHVEELRKLVTFGILERS